LLNLLQQLRLVLALVLAELLHGKKLVARLLDTTLLLVVDESEHLARYGSKVILSSTSFKLEIPLPVALIILSDNLGLMHLADCRNHVLILRLICVRSYRRLSL
jgi:hypothetical protein